MIPRRTHPAHRGAERTSRARARRTLGATLVALAFTHGVQAARTPDAMAPIANEEIGGRLLTVRPTLPYDHGAIRVIGPDGYSARQRLEGGDSITIDLVEEGRRPETSQELPSSSSRDGVERLVDGLYKYELVLYFVSGTRRAQTGRFFVDGGSAISRDAKRVQLGAVRSDLEEQRSAQRLAEQESLGSGPQNAYTAGDWIQVNDSTFDNETALTLDNDGVGVPPGYYWGMANDYDSLELGRTYTNIAITYPHLTVEVGGDIGIGTSAPSSRLHVSSFFPRAVRISGPNERDASFGVGSSGFWLYDGDEEPVAKFDHSAGADALVVDDSGVTVNGDSIHLRSSGGSAEVLVEELNTYAGRRQMFALENNGPPEFVLRDKNNGSTWKFGLRGQSFEINKGGSGQTEWTLTQSGNLTITGTLSQGSSRTIKKDFEAIDTQSILEKVNALPLLEWSYESAEEADRHFGPMAEDFHEAFGLGADAELLAPGDAAGIALAAIQGLSELVQQKDEEIAQLIERIERLERQSPEP